MSWLWLVCSPKIAGGGLLPLYHPIWSGGAVPFVDPQPQSWLSLGSALAVGFFPASHSLNSRTPLWDLSDNASTVVGRFAEIISSRLEKISWRFASSKLNLGETELARWGIFTVTMPTRRCRSGCITCRFVILTTYTLYVFSSGWIPKLTLRRRLESDELSVTKASHHANDAHQLEGNAMGIKWKQLGVGISSLPYIHMLLQAPSQTPLDLEQPIMSWGHSNISRQGPYLLCQQASTVIFGIQWSCKYLIRRLLFEVQLLHLAACMRTLKRATAIRIQFITQIRTKFLSSNSTIKLFARQHSGWTWKTRPPAGWRWYPVYSSSAWNWFRTIILSQ